MQLNDHQLWFSYRGLAPHQFTPVLGVHPQLQWMVAVARTTEPGRYISKEN
jgi:hypothetical protein